MSRTISTISGSDFYTNINSEQLLGILCKIAGVKYFESKSKYSSPLLAYSMTKEDSELAVSGLTSLLDKVEEIWPEVKYHFEVNSTPNDLKEFIEYYVKCFRDSNGYECIG